MNDLLNTVKNIDIRFLIEKETELSFNSKNVLDHCPFCNSGNGNNGTSAFSINSTKNIFKCFSCDKKGGSIEFIKLFKSLDDKEAIHYLSDKYADIPYQKPVMTDKETDLSKVIYAIKGNDTFPASDYLAQRGIEVNRLPENCFFYDKIGHSVVFLDTKNQLINKRLISPVNGTKSKHEQGSVLTNSIYAKTFDDSQSQVFITEGVINALSLYEYSAIAIFSTSNCIKSANVLAPYIREKKVILAFDNDAAGNKCTEYYSKFILEKGFTIKNLYRLQLPEGKDTNDLKRDGNLTSYLNNTENYLPIYVPATAISEIEKPINKDSENKEDDFSLYQYYRKEGCYFTKETFRKVTTEIKLSNFLMDILYHFVDGTQNTRRLIKLQHYKGKITIIEALSSELKNDAFETILKSHNCTFFGNSYQLKLIFSNLMENQKEAFALSTLGYNPEHEIYAFSDSVLTWDNKLIKVNEIGIASYESQNYYLPAYSQTNINNKAYLNERKFRFKQGKLTFKEWSELIYKAYGLNGAISILYFINSLFRDIVFRENNFFPFLFAFGQAGVGKSSMIDFLLRPFGDKEIGTSIKNSTVKAISRICSQKRNAIVFLKEYDSTIDRELIAFFKNAYDGAGYSIAQMTSDAKTSAFFVETALLIDGNVLPASESALYDRMIILHFERSSFTEEATEAYKQLIDKSDEGLGQILVELLSFRSIFKSEYKSTFRAVYDELKYNDIEFTGIKIEKLPERTLKHIAFLLTPFNILAQKLTFPFSFNELVKKVLQDAIDKVEQLNDLKDSAIFWDAINWERKKDFPTIKENIHFIKELHNKLLYIKIKELYSVYAAYCKANNIQSVDISTLTKLIRASKNYNPPQQKGNKGCDVKFGLRRCDKFSFDISNEDNKIIIDEKEIDI